MGPPPPCEDKITDAAVGDSIKIANKNELLPQEAQDSASMSVLPLGILHSPRVLIRTTEKGERSKANRMNRKNLVSMDCRKNRRRHEISEITEKKLIQSLESAIERTKISHCTEFTKLPKPIFFYLL